MKDLTSSDSSITTNGRRSVSQIIRLAVRNGEIFCVTGLGGRIQPVDATHALNRSAGHHRPLSDNSIPVA
jgi:hypothetical protein